MQFHRALLRRLSRFILVVMLVACVSPFGVHGGAMASQGAIWLDICTPGGIEQQQVPDRSGSNTHGVFDHCPLCLIQSPGVPSSAMLQLPRLPAVSATLETVSATPSCGPPSPPFDSRAPPARIASTLF